MKLVLRAYWDRIAAWVLVGIGALALLIGWIGVSGTGLPSEQLPYVVSGGVGGIALIGIGATVWISADLRDEWRQLRAVEDAIRESRPDPVPGSPGGVRVNGEEPVATPPRRRSKAKAGD